MESHGDRLVTTNSNDEKILYFGHWMPIQKGRVAYRYSNAQYNACEFSFKGSTVKWIGCTGHDQGYADVYLDGEFQCAVDGYSRVTRNGIVKFDKNSLRADGIHTLRIVVKKGRDSDATDCRQDIAGFQSVAPIHYPTEIMRLRSAEYAHIRRGTKSYLTSDAWSPVAKGAHVPVSRVILHQGIFSAIFHRNIAYLNSCFSQPSYCSADYPHKPDGGPGWSAWLPASNDGRMLAGAAHTLRWEERTDMRTIVNTIVTAISDRMQEDGYVNYYPESDSYAQNTGLNSERKNYDRVFWTRGLLAAGMAGDTRVYPILRRMYDWFNASPYLPDMLEGSNATNGLPGGPLMYLSPVGVDSDLIVTERYYDQDYWMAELKNKEPLCISHYPGERPHCYDLLGLEAFVDEFKATGATKYIDAATGGWDIFRDNYKHIGGVIAICEADGPYPPKSYYITMGHNGETCGSVFWINLNSKLLQLYPDQERYAGEIEEALLNVVAAAQTNSGNIRYHNKLHGVKEGVVAPGNTCCEVSTVGLIGRLPEFIYSIDAQGIYVNLYAASSLTWDQAGGDVTLTTATAFPYHPEVSITVTTSEKKPFTIRIRIPSWATGSMMIKVNGADFVTGQLGSYVSLNRTWSDQDVILFTLPIGAIAIEYTGLDQVDGNYDRYALMYGPVLMALQGELTGPSDVPQLAAMPADVPDLLVPVEQRPLEFTIRGYPGYKCVPYWTIDAETFTCFPIVQSL